MSIIQADNVTKHYSGRKILDNISFHVDKGKTVGIQSTDSLSKSIFLKTLSGSSIPDSGSIYMNGEQLNDSGYPPEYLGIWIDEPGFVRSFNGFKNLKYLAEINAPIHDINIVEVMRFVGLNPYSVRKVCNFSYTMYKKLCLAQTIINNEEILLLNDPLELLTPIGIEQMQNILYALRFYDKTIVLTGCNLETFQELCDEVYVLDHGKLSMIP